LAQPCAVLGGANHQLGLDLLRGGAPASANSLLSSPLVKVTGSFFLGFCHSLYPCS